jgi:peroxiredoxin (alkyl hydroperoxide reductase subunit C)
MFKGSAPMKLFSNQEIISIARVGCRAPHFRAATSNGSVSFPGDYSGKWVIFFCLPTCTSDSGISGIISLSTVGNEFEELLISDPDHKVSKLYGVIQPSGSNIDLSGIVFFIDPNAIIRGMVHYPITLKPGSEALKKLIVLLQTMDDFTVSLSFDQGEERSRQFSPAGSSEEMEFDVVRQEKKQQPCDCFYCTST